VTRHLVVVAMSQPLATSPRVPHSTVFGSAEGWQSIAMLLYQVRDHHANVLRTVMLTTVLYYFQDRVRLHMVLHASPQLDGFRDFFQNMVCKLKAMRSGYS
jgi:hypothetical protein